MPGICCIIMSIGPGLHQYERRPQQPGVQLHVRPRHPVTTSGPAAQLQAKAISTPPVTTDTMLAVAPALAPGLMSLKSLDPWIFDHDFDDGLDIPLDPDFADGASPFEMFTPSPLTEALLASQPAQQPSLQAHLPAGSPAARAADPGRGLQRHAPLPPLPARLPAAGDFSSYVDITVSDHHGRCACTP